MIGIVLCLAAFIATYALANRSLGHGFVVLLTVGYGYGLLRARIGDVGSHFLFDASLLGLYVSRFTREPSETELARSKTAKAWTILLVVWPFLCIAYSPLIPDSQPLIIQFVGLRGAALMVPCIVLGARMTRADLDTIAPALAVLNLIALTFGLLEYVYGIQAFIPRSEVTDIVYASRDVDGASESFYRIPSTFIAAHAYGGTMVISIPFVAHGLESGRRVRILCWTGIGAAVLGAFLCGARLPVIILGLATIYVFGSRRMRVSTIFAFALTALAVAYVVFNFERFQRFTTLGDTEMVQRRFSGSMNMSFLDVLTSYPVGVGLASAFGTNIPYFLSSTAGVHAQIGMETEYGRIMLEQGFVGLGLWLSFIVYSSLQRRKSSEASPTSAGYMFALVMVTWLTGLVGTGLLLAVPTTPLFLAMIGFRIKAPAAARNRLALRHVGAPRPGISAGPPGPRALVAQRSTR